VSTRSTEWKVLQALPDLYALTPFERFPARCLAVVTRVLGADKGVYTEVDIPSGDFRVFVHPEPPELRLLEEARRTHMREHPLLVHLTLQPTEQALMISDVLPRRQFRRTPLYGEFFGPLGVEDQLSVTVSDGRGTSSAAVSIDRGGRGFDEHDRHLMNVLRPHLVASRRNAMGLRRALARQRQNDALDGAEPLARLTERQREILGHVASGSTNAQIALTLDISLGTVRKHLEHILDRLGVSSRTAAAYRYITHEPAAHVAWTASIPSMLCTPSHCR
jgi:DNA-binding CsgD family transcriptional regulator